MIPLRAKRSWQACTRRRRAWFTCSALLVAIMLAGLPPQEAGSTPLYRSQPPARPLTLAQSGVKTSAPVTKAETSATDAPEITPPEAGKGAASHQREDLSVFFSIGMAINIIMVAAFLVWAVGQWRKTKK